MSEEELPYILIELDRKQGPHYDIFKNTLKNRVIEKDGLLLYQFYNYSGWVNQEQKKGRIVDRFKHGREAGQAKWYYIEVARITLA